MPRRDNCAVVQAMKLQNLKRLRFNGLLLGENPNFRGAG
jgi:hypothetical protein